MTQKRLREKQKYRNTIKHSKKKENNKIFIKKRKEKAQEIFLLFLTILLTRFDDTSCIVSK